MSDYKEKFSLWLHLKADILRRGQIIHGEKFSPTSNFYFFVGLLSPRLMPVLLYRLSYFFSKYSYIRIFSKFFSAINFFLFGVEIAVTCYIGPGFYLPHPVGVVIGASQIGSSVTILQGVTIGAKELDISFNDDLRPVLGSNIVVGAGAKILGSIKVSDCCTIGANAVVICDTQGGSTYVGIPARRLSDRK